MFEIENGVFEKSVYIIRCYKSITIQGDPSTFRSLVFFTWMLLMCIIDFLNVSDVQVSSLEIFYISSKFGVFLFFLLLF